MQRHGGFGTTLKGAGGTRDSLPRFSGGNELTMARTYKVAGISGSLRGGSDNTATLRAAQELAPDALEIEIVTLEDVPLFNQDVEARGWPPRVQELRDRIEASDAVIFASPEYNHSVTGALKNAIDWLSRPGGRRAAEWQARRNRRCHAGLRRHRPRTGASATDRLLQRDAAPADGRGADRAGERAVR